MHKLKKQFLSFNLSKEEKGINLQSQAILEEMEEEFNTLPTYCNKADSGSAAEIKDQEELLGKRKNNITFHKRLQKRVFLNDEYDQILNGEKKKESQNEMAAEIKSDNLMRNNQGGAIAPEMPQDEAYWTEKEEKEKKAEKKNISRRRSYDSLTEKQLADLYRIYVDEYSLDQKTYGSQYKKKRTIRSIATSLHLAKTTVGRYFNIFKKTPDYLIKRMIHQRKTNFALMRKYKPKNYSIANERKLTEFILRNRQAGIPVSYRDIKNIAPEILLPTKPMTYSSRWIGQFLRRNNLSKRKIGHSEDLAREGEIKKKIDSFLLNLKILNARFKYSHDYIINLDETPVFFDYCTHTVDRKGAKFVRKLKLGPEKRKLTCALAVTASGKFLPTCLIYNRKEILNLQSMKFENNFRFYYNKSGWMDENIMLSWLKHVLLPYVKQKRTLLVFDSFKAHVCKSFEKEILNRDNIDLVIIPGGLTYLLQPLDVSINKPFKDIIKKNWNDFLSSQRTRILHKYEDEDSDNDNNQLKRIEITKDKIKTPSLRKKLKKGLFNEARKRNKKSNLNSDDSEDLPKISSKEVVEWVDVALKQIRENKVELIQKAFKICGISVKSNGSEDHLIHDFDYIRRKISRLNSNIENPNAEI